MPLSLPQAGQVSSFAAWSAVFGSRTTRANTASRSPSGSSSAVAVRYSPPSPSSTTTDCGSTPPSRRGALPVNAARTSAASAAVAAMKYRSRRLSRPTPARQIFAGLISSRCGSASGDSAAHPERPQTRQYTAGRWACAGRATLSVPGSASPRPESGAGHSPLPDAAAVSSAAPVSTVCRAAVRSSSCQRNSGRPPTPLSTRVTGRTHRCASMCSRGRGRRSSDSGSRAADSSATNRVSASSASRGLSLAVRAQAYPNRAIRSRSPHSSSGSPFSRASTPWVKSCVFSRRPIWNASSPRRPSIRSASASRSSRSGDASTPGPPETSTTSLGVGGSGSV
ncbi:hypothetical protein M2169_004790 [Streptomyces sp. MJP52]|nr:hypothetical protein [Streptomyces sp. MJP52]